MRTIIIQMADRRNEANLLFVIYSLSTIGLLSAMAIYSSYLTWWWREVTPTLKGFEITWKTYYIAYLIMTITAGVVLIWSVVVFLDFLVSRGINSPFIRSYLRTSLLAHVALLIIPIVLLLTIKVSDPRLVLWVVWIIVNLILGTFALSIFEKYITVVVVPDARANLITDRI